MGVCFFIPFPLVVKEMEKKLVKRRNFSTGAYYSFLEWVSWDLGIFRKCTLSIYQFLKMGLSVGIMEQFVLPVKCVSVMRLDFI